MPRSARVRACVIPLVVVASLAVAGCGDDRPARPPGTGGAAGPPTEAHPVVVPDSAPATNDAAAGVACSDVRAVSEPGVRGLTDLVMVSPRKGIAVGKGVIFVTDDGRHWEQRYSDPSWFSSAEMVDSDHAWAVGQHSLLATEDGGRNWLPVGQPTGTSLRAVDFVDRSTGWGSDRKHVYRTTDGGRSWVLADPRCGAERICFSAAEDGWAARGIDVFRTIDGGRTWTDAFQLPVEASDNQFNAMSISVQGLECAAGGLVWALFAGQLAGTQFTPYVAYHGSADGAWTPVLKAPGGPPPTVAAPEGGPHPAPLDVVETARVVYSSFTPSSTPSVAVSTASTAGSGPKRWHPVPIVFSVTSVSFPAGSTGWMLGPRAGATNADVIVTTHDGERTWHEQLTRPVEPPGE
jgi:hypothetical protein